MLYSYRGIWPSLEGNAYTAPTACVIGDVVLETGSSCWFGAVLRGDEANIHLGKNSNIQDNCIVHCDKDVPLIIGENVTVGHGVILHSCTIGDCAMIGMGAIVLNRAVIGEGAVVAAGAVVKEGENIPPNTLFAGIPATFKKELNPAVRQTNIANAMEYVQLASDYQSMEAK